MKTLSEHRDEWEREREREIERGTTGVFHCSFDCLKYEFLFVIYRTPSFSYLASQNRNMNVSLGKTSFECRLFLHNLLHV